MEDYLITFRNLRGKNRLDFFKSLKDELKAELIEKLRKREVKEILKGLSEEEIVRFSHFLDLDELVDLLQSMEEEKRKNVLKKLNEELREKVKFLLRFDPRTAGGLMDLNYIIVSKGEKKDRVVEKIRKHIKRVGKVPVILVEENRKLVGELPIYSLSLMKRNEKIDKYVKRIPHVKYNESEERIINKFKAHQHDKIAVLDDDGSVIGVIYADDLLKLIGEKDSLLDFAGVSEEESATDSFLDKVKRRYKWLILNLFTAFLAASVVAIFQKTIEKFALLAAYMPIIAGMGGNAATQTLAIIVRGLALNEVNFNNVKHVLLNEVLAGMINGMINGVLVAIVAVFINQNPLLGLIAFIAMVVNLIVAGFFGTIIPIVLKAIGKDPATSATIFITTATDLFGFFTFLGLAELLL